MFKKIVFFGILNFFPIKSSVDLIVFSYDRGIQLYATLESSERYLKGISQTYVLYRASEGKFDVPYQDMKERFSCVNWIKQGENPKKDFKPLLMSILCSSSADYILFAVDDNIVKDFVDLSVCVNVLEKTKAYAFYLRLGKNINYSYSCKIRTPIPCMHTVDKNVFVWKFEDGKGDWNYPNSVDMTLFRKNNIISNISKLNFSSPNYFEGAWALRASSKLNGLCFNTSKIFNIPMNIVQQSHKNNPHMNLYSKEYLLKLYMDGYKINIDDFYNINNNSPHFEIEPKFIKR